MQAVTTPFEKHVSVMLLESGENSTYSWSGKASSYDDAVERARAAALEDIGNHLNFDDVISVIQGEAEYVMPGEVFVPTNPEVVSLHQPGINLSWPDEFTPAPDVIVQIDMNAVRAAAKVLHANRGLLQSVQVGVVNHLLGDNVSPDEFCSDGAWIEISGIDDDGNPQFGTFYLRRKHTDQLFSKGLYFNQPNFGDWAPAGIAYDESEVTVASKRDDGWLITQRQVNDDGVFIADDNLDDALQDDTAAVITPPDDMLKELRIELADLAEASRYRPFIGPRG